MASADEIFAEGYIQGSQYPRGEGEHNAILDGFGRCSSNRELSRNCITGGRSPKGKVFNLLQRIERMRFERVSMLVERKAGTYAL